MELLKHAFFHRDSPKRRILVGAFWVLLGSLLWTKALLYSQNTLFFNPHWAPYIPSLQNLQKGNVETLFGRSIVAGQHLRSLGSQERRVFSRRMQQPREFEFTFRLKENSAVAFLFNGQGEKFSAIRLGAHPLRSSLYYQSNLNEEFVNPVALPLKIPTHRSVRAQFREAPEGIKITIDGQEIHTIVTAFEKGIVGLEVMSGAELWAPSLDGEELPFQREAISPRFYFPMLGLFTFTALLLYPVRRSFVNAAAFLGVLGASWLAFDFYAYSNYSFAWHASELTTTNRTSVDVEKWRYKFFQRVYRFFGGETLTPDQIAAAGVPQLIDKQVRYCIQSGCKSLETMEFSPPSAQTLRVVVLGGSIGAGWGVTHYEKTYSEELQKKLQANLAGKYDVEVLNLSDAVSTYNSRRAEKFRIIDQFRPQVIVIEILFNFIEAQAFRSSLEQTDPRSAKFYLLPLINPFALSKTHLRAVQKGRANNPVLDQRDRELLLQIGQKTPLQVLDPNPFLLSEKVLSGGRMFWDYYHPTNWGHAQLATYLAQEITAQLAGVRPGHGP